MAGRTLALELAIVLIVKFLALGVLWLAFFRPGASPPAEPARMFAPAMPEQVPRKEPPQ